MVQKKKDNKDIQPTRAELEILRVLWQSGPSTVRHVNDELNKTNRKVQYSSTLKLMQIMVEKGLLKRDESNMKHIYIPVEEEKTKKVLLDRFLDILYSGSPASLMMQLLNRKMSKNELDNIKDLLKKLDKE